MAPEPQEDATSQLRAARLHVNLSPYMRNAITDNLDDIECHADEWILPSLSPTTSSRSGRTSTHSQFECTAPSPLIHDICEEKDLPTTICRLSCCFKHSRSEDKNGGGSPYIPIPKRLRRHRRTDSEIMIRLTDSEFELASDGTAVIKMRKQTVYWICFLKSSISLVFFFYG
jgi:hypothetical protein